MQQCQCLQGSVWCWLCLGIVCVHIALHLLMEQKSAAACRPCGSLETQASGTRRPSASTPSPCRPAILARLLMDTSPCKSAQDSDVSRNECDAAANPCRLTKKAIGSETQDGVDSDFPLVHLRRAPDPSCKPSRSKESRSLELPVVSRDS